MPSPVTPANAKSVLIAANSMACDKFRSDSKFRIQYYQLVKWAIKDDGSPTPNFLAWIGQSTGVLEAPTGVSVANGTTLTTITWAAVSGATKYDVYRSTTNDTGTLDPVLNRVSVDNIGTSYEDTTVVANQVYFYWVKAKNDTGASSAYSAPGSGYAGSGAVATVVTFNASASWTSTFNGTIEIEMWGGGGGGGGGASYGFGGTGGGGGGGSGGHSKFTSVAVTVGQIFTITFDPGLPTDGSGGAAQGDGTKGASITVLNSGALVGSATGGGRGLHGVAIGAGASGGAAGVGSTANGTAGTAGTPGSPGPAAAGAGGAAPAGGANPGGAGGGSGGAGVAGGPASATIKRLT